VAGACASIAVAQPLDVIKTRIQKRDFSDRTSGMSILTDMVGTIDCSCGEWWRSGLG
jgi:hypothetical protein